MNNKPLKIGNWVHCILYGGKDGVIFRIVGEQAPESVASIGGFMMTGGRAEFDIVWENGSISKSIPECIIRGVQWHLREELADAPDAVIGAMLKHAKEESERKAAENKAAAEKFAAEVEALKTNPEYSNLERTGGNASGGKLVAINLRKELKKLFPKTKFSVKSDFNSVRIRWTDGPLVSEVETVTCKYSGGHFDGMDDSYKHERSPFTEVFGSAQYIFENRDHSPAALTAAAEYVSKQYGEPMPEIKTSSDGTAYLGNYEHDFQRKVYDYIERKSNYAEVK